MDEWVPTKWELSSRFEDKRGEVRRVEVHKLVSPFYDGYKYAVRSEPWCLSKKGEWEYEPLPSSRTDAFYKRCRFDSLEEAQRMGAKHIVDIDYPKVEA